MNVEAAVDAYVAAWNTEDADARRELLATAVTDDCEYAGPTGRAVGRAELNAAIAEARDYVPGAGVQRAGGVEMEGARSTFRWVVVGPGGGALLQGTDVVETAADGRLRRITVLAGNG